MDEKEGKTMTPKNTDNGIGKLEVTLTLMQENYDSIVEHCKNTEKLMEEFRSRPRSSDIGVLATAMSFALSQITSIYEDLGTLWEEHYNQFIRVVEYNQKLNENLEKMALIVSELSEGETKDTSKQIEELDARMKDAEGMIDAWVKEFQERKKHIEDLKKKSFDEELTLI